MRAFVFAVVAMCVGVPSASADDSSFIAEPGVPNLIWAYYSVNSTTCLSSSGLVKVLTKPQHGKLMPRVMDYVIPRRGQACGGKLIQAFVVHYTPDRAFRGNDRFSLDVTYGNGEREVDNYTISVP